nr:immunoglobulin heavy chain junction region [Mus musculus]
CAREGVTTVVAPLYYYAMDYW